MHNHNHSHHHSHPGGSMESFMSKIEFLDSAMRQRLLPPEEILAMLPIQKDSEILDAGAGSGYLTLPAARQTEGMVTALDMDDRMLRVIEEKAKAEDIANIRLVQGDIEAVPLADDAVDFAIASLILHEVRSLSAVLAEMSRVVKPGGYFLCLEYEKEESTVKGPPMHIRIPSADMESALAAAGFHVEQKIFPKESIYIITAKKQAAD